MTTFTESKAQAAKDKKEYCDEVIQYFHSTLKSGHWASPDQAFEYAKICVELERKMREDD